MLIEVKDIDDVFRISEPWYIDHCSFNDELKQLDVYVKYRKGATFDYSDCGAPVQDVYDIVD